MRVLRFTKGVSGFRYRASGLEQFALSLAVKLSSFRTLGFGVDPKAPKP